MRGNIGAMERCEVFTPGRTGRRLEFYALLTPESEDP
jgi:hypothetical protein